MEEQIQYFKDQIKELNQDLNDQVINAHQYRILKEYIDNQLYVLEHQQQQQQS